MAEQLADGTWKCVYCGITAPRGHWRQKTWIEKHEKNCAKNPANKEE